MPSRAARCCRQATPPVPARRRSDAARGSPAAPRLAIRTTSSSESANDPHANDSRREVSMHVNLRPLIGKLNTSTRNTLDGAAGLCLSRTHYDVEIEHFLVKALDGQNDDLAVILKHFGVNRSRLADDLARGLDRLKSGNARTPGLGPSLVKMLSEAWLVGSVEYGAPEVRTGHCLVALLASDELARMAPGISRELEK